MKNNKRYQNNTLNQYFKPAVNRQLSFVSPFVVSSVCVVLVLLCFVCLGGVVLVFLCHLFLVFILPLLCLVFVFVLVFVFALALSSSILFSLLFFSRLIFHVSLHSHVLSGSCVVLSLACLCFCIVSSCLFGLFCPARSCLHMRVAFGMDMAWQVLHFYM